MALMINKHFYAASRSGQFHRPYKRVLECRVLFLPCTIKGKDSVRRYGSWLACRDFNPQLLKLKGSQVDGDVAD